MHEFLQSPATLATCVKMLCHVPNKIPASLAQLRAVTHTLIHTFTRMRVSLLICSLTMPFSSTLITDTLLHEVLPGKWDMV